VGIKDLEKTNEFRRNGTYKDVNQRNLYKNDIMIKDIQKMQNFIPGVSLDELIYRTKHNS